MNDTAIVAQRKNFENLEEKLAATLNVLGKYYRCNHLKPNPGKTQVCAFHLRIDMPGTLLMSISIINIMSISIG